MASTSTASSTDLGPSLAKVRRLHSSNLSHQSKPAQLLIAIESAISASLSSTTLPHPATAYFAALLQCLEKACADEVNGTGGDDEMAETENMGQGALIPATLYLLAIIVPETPSQVVLSKVSPLLECVLPLFDTALEHPPALRSLIQIITSLLLISPASLLNGSPLLKKSWSYMLELNLDPRPKVRHLAQEGVRKTLTTPIPPKLSAANHPYLGRARDWVTSHLEEETKGGGSSGKKRARFADAEDGEGKKAIWVIQGLRGWVTVWGEDKLSELCSQLLSLPPISHLTPQVYSLLALLLAPPPIDASGPRPSTLSNLPTILDSLISSPPELQSPLADIPAYLSAITSALTKMALQDPLTLPSYLTKAYALFNSILLAPSANSAVLVSASEAIGKQGIVRYCITDEMILAAVNYHRSGSDQPGARKKQKTPFLSKLLSSLIEAMDKNALRLQYLLPILAAAVSRLRLRTTSGPPAEIDETGNGVTAAEELLLGVIADVGDLRLARGFEHQDRVDEVLGMALEVIGVEGVLSALPLNIEPDESGNTPTPGRAHLLPLIRLHATNDSLQYFATYFRPLSERIFSRKVAAEDAGKAGEGKVWEVLVGQVWDCFPGFCEMPRDMKTGLTTPFMTLLANLLNTQPLLLPSVLRGLSSLITTTQRLVNSTTEPQVLRKQFGLDQGVARDNLAYLKTLAKDMTSVLLNVFSRLPREQRGMVGDVIGLWTGIMSEADLVATYNTVTTHLSSSLSSSAPAAPGASPISHTMLDLLIIFVPHLPATQSRSLFNATSTGIMLEHVDATVQKKSYRLLQRLIEGGKVEELVAGEKVGDFVQNLLGCGGGVGPGAQRDRLRLLETVVNILPRDKLHLVTELLSEAVLGTKEVNEKSRGSGFDLLVAMGNKMAQGGEISGDVAEGSSGSTKANVEEFITMVAAGLAGNTPHMISASINALSRLLFEFKDDIPDTMISELVSTITVFLTTKNREIIKSAIGFVKVATVALPESTVTPHLPQLVPALLGWVHDHKNHFKAKTVHIFERMMRKFGYEAILANVPSNMSGEKKVLEAIKRRKEKAKRRKANAEGDDDEEDEKPKTSSGNAFEDVLYNSDSEASDDDEDEQAPSGRSAQQSGKQGKKDRRAQGSTYIRAEGDEPMDLLSRSIAGGITSANPNAAGRKRKPGQDARRFKTDETGKLLINEPEYEEQEQSSPGFGGEGTAFMSAQRGVDGQTRDAKGNLRFNKNTKKAREEDRDMEGMEVDASEANGVARKLQERKKKRASMEKLGGEFKAKGLQVLRQELGLIEQRAGGDIKRGAGPDPYSYVPIGQAARNKAGKGGGRMNLTNKKKGSRR